MATFTRISCLDRIAAAAERERERALPPPPGPHGHLSDLSRPFHFIPFSFPAPERKLAMMNVLFPGQEGNPRSFGGRRFVVSSLMTGAKRPLNH